MSQKKLKPPKPPKPPLSRVIRDGVCVWCNYCGSTMSRTIFFRLFGKRKCDNNKCNQIK